MSTMHRGSRKIGYDSRETAPYYHAVALLSLLVLGVLAEVVNAIEVPIPKEQMVYGDFPSWADG
jgi:hypothetical protein